MWEKLPNKKGWLLKTTTQTFILTRSKRGWTIMFKSKEEGHLDGCKLFYPFDDIFPATFDPNKEWGRNHMGCLSMGDWFLRKVVEPFNNYGKKTIVIKVGKLKS